jgi:hypothetical protein
MCLLRTDVADVCLGDANFFTRRDGPTDATEPTSWGSLLLSSLAYCLRSGVVLRSRLEGLLVLVHHHSWNDG